MRASLLRMTWSKLQRPICSSALPFIRRAFTRRGWASTRRGWRSGRRGSCSCRRSIGSSRSSRCTRGSARSRTSCRASASSSSARSSATREVAFEFAAESSDRMDRIADTARLVGGFAFTGTSRHFVQYRDAAAPFGYDAPSARLDRRGAGALSRSLLADVRDRARDRPARAAPAADAAERARRRGSSRACASSSPSRASGRRSPTTWCGRTWRATSASPSGRRRARSSRRPSAAGCFASRSSPSACARSCTPRPGITCVRPCRSGRRGRSGVSPRHRPPRVPALRQRGPGLPAWPRRRALDASTACRRWAR